MAKKRINVRSKGAAGEREFCDWLHDTLGLDMKPERNLDQVRNGGSDINTLPPFMFEIKRCEGLSKREWWAQVKTASRPFSRAIPVVAYRQNRKPWRFLISATYIGLDKGYVELEELEFTKWLKQYFGIA